MAVESLPGGGGDRRFGRIRVLRPGFQAHFDCLRENAGWDFGIAGAALAWAGTGALGAEGEAGGGFRAMRHWASALGQAALLLQRSDPFGNRLAAAHNQAPPEMPEALQVRSAPLEAPALLVFDDLLRDDTLALDSELRGMGNP